MDAYRFINNWAQEHLVDEAAQQVEALYTSTLRYFEGQRRQQAYSTVREPRTRDTRTSPDRRLHSPRRPQLSYLTSATRPAYSKTVYPTPTFRSQTPCIYCGRPHGPTCYVLNPDKAPDDWVPPAPTWLRCLRPVRGPLPPPRLRGRRRRPSGLDLDQQNDPDSQYDITPRRDSSQHRSPAPRRSSPQPSSSQQRRQSSSPRYHTAPPPSSYSAPKRSVSFYTAAGEDLSRAPGAEGDSALDGCYMADLDPTDLYPAYPTVTRGQASSRPVAPAAPVRTAAAAAPRAPMPAATAASNSPRPAPAIHRRPAPQPFAPTALPRDVPMAQLPDPVRAARQRLAEPPRAYQHAPTAPAARANQATAASLACTMSFTHLMGLGPSIIKAALAANPTLLVHGVSGMPVLVPVDHLSIDLGSLPADTRRQLLLAYAQAEAPQAPAAAYHATSPASITSAAAVLFDFTPAVDEAAVDATVAPPAEDLPAAEYTEWLVVPGGGPLAEVADAAEHAQDEHQPTVLATCTPQVHITSAAPPGHASGLALQPEWDPPKATIFSLTPDLARAATLTCTATGKLHMNHLASMRTVIDTGSTLHLITKAAATAAQLTWNASACAHMITSSGHTVPTLGRVSTPVSVTLSHSDPENRVSLELELHVVDGPHNFDLLLGAQFLLAVGAIVDTTPPATLTYHTAFPLHGVAANPVTLLLITSVQS